MKVASTQKKGESKNVTTLKAVEQHRLLRLKSVTITPWKSVRRNRRLSASDLQVLARVCSKIRPLVNRHPARATLPLR
ncbi:uncharacterized protein KRP23_13412 [Phytophthora ramorum]|uniref:uncharacterized protein n=1 Tax=Phytophthora ramorum TaxID=164328 RepID=UPI0030AF3B60|nr:hypothetical protein KRP23_13412 [Phytophthora ramorum]